MIIEKPGIYRGVSNEDYHKSKGISNSGIKEMMDCPKMYWYKYLSGEYQRPNEDHFQVGQVIHTLALEPETFDQRYFVTKKINRQSKQGKEAYKEMLLKAANKDVITEEDFKIATLMANNLINHAMFKKLKGTGHIEDSIMWQDEDSGALFRTRPDFYNSFLILDIKSTKDVRPASFSKAIFEYGYHRQGAMACDGLYQATGIYYDMVILFAVSKQPPYLVRAYVLKEEALQLGREEYKREGAIYQRCLTENNWPAYEEIIEDINLPTWAYRRNDNE